MYKIDDNCAFSPMQSTATFLSLFQYPHFCIILSLLRYLHFFIILSLLHYPHPLKVISFFFRAGRWSSLLRSGSLTAAVYNIGNIGEPGARLLMNIDRCVVFIRCIEVRSSIDSFITNNLRNVCW